MKAVLSLCRSSSHYDGVRDALGPLKDELKESLSKISSLVIKINLVITRTPAYDRGVPLATTPLRAIVSFIDFISPFYKGKIIVAEEAAWGDTKEGFRMYGFSELARENEQIELLDLQDDEVIQKRITYAEGELELPLSKTMLEAPLLVSITRPKTHCSVVMTAGIKNVVVGAIHGYSTRRKIHRGKAIHHIMACIADLVFPDLVVIDGTVGMESGGPVRGKEIKSGWTLSSFDALAADSLAAYLMGFDVNDVGYLSLLIDKGLGLSYPHDEIEIAGEQPGDLVTPFKPHGNFKKTRMWR